MEPNFNSIWDEHQWEAHLNELEKNSSRKKRLVNNARAENEPVWLRFLKESENVEDALENFIDDELIYDESYFPDDFDELEDEDDVDDDLFLFSGDEWADSNTTTGSEELKEEEYILDPGEEMGLSEDEDDVIPGEEWKLNWDDESLMSELEDESDPFGTYYVYDEAHELSLYFLKRSIEFPEALVSPIYTEMVNEITQITTRFAAALSFDHREINYLGAVITYCKRAIRHANNALELIRKVKNEGNLTTNEYPVLYTRLFELRNETGLLIQEMREYLLKGGII